MVIHFLEQEAVQPLNGLSELVPNAVQSNDQEIEKNSRKKKRSKKNKSPMSKTHYTGNDPEGDVAGARFTCTQCHVPLSNASPLVDSTFR